MRPDPRECSGAAAFAVVGEAYAASAIREVSFGNHRFEEILRATAAPRDVLTKRLKTLVAVGVLERRPYSERPLRHEYHLAEAGRALVPVLLQMGAWGAQWLDAVPCAETTHGSDHALDPRVVCRTCGEDVALDELTFAVKPCP
jgi:DNA-binding HxlR family transcriptional regulator